MVTSQQRRRARRTLPVMFAAAALVVSGCGSGDSGDEKKSVDEETTSTVPSSAGDAAEPDTGPGSEAVAFLPSQPEPADGTGHGVATCEVAGDAPEPEPGTRHPTWITYAVPSSWTATGWGSAGSGSATGSDESLTFSIEQAGDVEFSLAWDQRDQEGMLTNFDQESLDSFDFETQVGDETVQVTYEQVATVAVGEQDVDLFHRAPDEDAQLHGEPQYKARMTGFEWPNQNLDGGTMMAETFVVTVDFDAANTGVTQDVVESVLASYTMPACTWDDIIGTYELITGTDLDGDGKVKSGEDVQKEAEEKLAELHKEMDESSGTAED